MPRHNETLLLFEPRPYARNQYATVLNQLGYWRLLYANYAEHSGFAPGIAPFEAVVAVWTEDDVAIDHFARAVASATSFAHVRGALVVSPFTNEDNVRLLARSGAKGWAVPPVSKDELAGRIGCLLRGDRRAGSDRRSTGQRAVPDRRRAPFYPLAAPA